MAWGAGYRAAAGFVFACNSVLLFISRLPPLFFLLRRRLSCGRWGCTALPLLTKPLPVLTKPLPVLTKPLTCFQWGCTALPLLTKPLPLLFFPDIWHGAQAIVSASTN
jgi:hypothetical protein